MPTEIRETEKKYEADADSSLPSLSDLPMVASESDSGEQVLEAEYYDTDDLRLLRAGMTLRRRTGGDDAGWHLKLPAGPDTRDEIRLPLGRTGRRVPAELAALVRAHARGQALQPVAEITTKRQLRKLLDASGSALAEVAADEVRARSMGEATAPSQWYEVEVELTGGSPDLLAAADQRLRRSGLRPAGRAAKLERALAGRLPAPPGKHGKPGQRPDAAAVVLAYAQAQQARLTAMDPQVRRDVPDAVHQMRVTTRRLRSTLKSFPRVLRTADTQHLSGELRWLGGVLGEARDAEVLAGHLRSSVDELPPEEVMGPVQARLRKHFGPVEAAGRTASLKALDSRRYLKLLDELDRLLADPPLAEQAGQPAAEALPAAVSRMRRRVSRRMRAARNTAGADRDAALHEARKAAKDARYAAELAAAVCGRDAERFARRVKKLQSVLGDQHDAVVARGTARELGVEAQQAGESSFTFGVIDERAHHRALALADDGWPVWKRAARRKYRKWMS